MPKEEICCIYLELEPYLAQWLVHDNGGSTPIVFRRLSVENRILESYMMKLPPNAKPDLPTATSTAIVIPTFRHKPPKYYNYLPKGAKKELRDVIRNRLIVELWTDLHHFGHIGKRKDHLILDWLAAHGIEENDTNYNAVQKIYQRQRRNYLERERYKRKNSKK